MKIARLVIYEGKPEQLSQQLSRSLAEGVHQMGMITISVVSLCNPNWKLVLEEPTEKETADEANNPNQ